MTLEELQKLEELEKAATPGPWVHSKMGAVWSGGLQDDERGYTRGEKDSFSIFEIEPDSYDGEALGLIEDDGEWFDSDGDWADIEESAKERADADSELIASMRTAFPELLRLARAYLETHGG